MEKKETNDVVCGFGCLKTYEGQKDFDETYKSVEIKKRVKKVGDGDEDFIIEEYEVVTETPIREVIDSQKDSVGIEAFMKPYILSGESLPGVEVSKEVQDFTRFPEDPADVIKVGDDMMKAFMSIDPSLRGDAKSPEEFLKTFTQDKFNAWLKSKVNVEKVEEKKNE